MPLVHQTGRERMIARGAAEQRQREAQRRAEAEAGRRADAKLLAEVESHLLAKLKAIEEDARLSDAARLEKRLRQLEQTPAAAPVRTPERPRGWGMAEEDILRRWRREAEEGQGPLARHETAMQAIRKHPEDELLKLGEKT